MLDERANNRRLLNRHPRTRSSLVSALQHERLNRPSDNEHEGDKRYTAAKNIYGVFVPSSGLKAWLVDPDNRM
jgi:hypothetical protein